MVGLLVVPLDQDSHFLKVHELIAVHGCDGKPYHCDEESDGAQKLSGRSIVSSKKRQWMPSLAN